jgi:hypothetical protein
MSKPNSTALLLLNRWRIARARRLVKKVGKGYHVGRVMRCDSECWQTGNCTGACER